MDEALHNYMLNSLDDQKVLLTQGLKHSVTNITQNSLTATPDNVVQVDDREVNRLVKKFEDFKTKRDAEVGVLLSSAVNAAELAKQINTSTSSSLSISPPVMSVPLELVLDGYPLYSLETSIQKALLDLNSSLKLAAYENRLSFKDKTLEEVKKVRTALGNLLTTDGNLNRVSQALTLATAKFAVQLAYNPTKTLTDTEILANERDVLVRDFHMGAGGSW